MSLFSRQPSSPAPLTPGSPWRAVLTGLAVDLGGTFLLNLILVMLYTAELAGTGMEADKIQAVLHNNPLPGWMVITGGLLGSALSVAGGFVCARIVRRDEFAIGGILAVLSPLSALLLGDDAPLDVQLVLLLASSAACVMLGAHWGRQQNLREAARAP